MSNYIAVTDLDNLPDGVRIDVYNLTRVGNVMSATGNNRRNFFITVTPSVPFEAGNIVEISMTINSITSGHYPCLSLSAGGANARWVMLSGIGSQTDLGTNNMLLGEYRQTGTFVARITFIDQSSAIQFRFYNVLSDYGQDYWGGEIVFNYLYANPPIDPYEKLDIPTSTTGGGPDSPTQPIGYDGIINDDIDFPDTPMASAVNANFISIWTPTLDQVQNLAKWMWTTDPLRWEFWQKLLQNPLELIFSLTIMPIPIFHTDESGTPAEDEIVANSDVLALGWQDTGITMDWITDQYITLDMGSIDIEEVWGAFLDYEPYTKIDIFLPYIGMKTLDTNDCMPRTISLKYKIDLATGTCLALIKCDNSVYYHFSGNCASQIPITVNQCQEIVRGLMTMAVGAATLVAGGAGVAAAGETTAVSGLTTAGGAAMMGRGADNAAKGVSVSRSGTICCAAGLMDVQTPYLVISRPRQALPKDQSKYTGYPAFITEQIGDLVGYTEVQIIHLENMTCTDEEYQEIDSLLLGGVII